MDIVILLDKVIGPYGALVLSVIGFVALAFWANKQFTSLRCDLDSCNAKHVECDRKNETLLNQMADIKQKAGVLEGKLSILENQKR